jgi:uncharacterized SAM-binding protein YcdF (DUF218 family)
VNDFLAALGLLSWKPLAGALLLPPVPLLLIALLAWRVRARRPITSALCLLLATIGLWFSLCSITGQWLERQWAPTAALSPAQVSDWRRSLAGHKPVVLVLGGGVQRLAPEYGEAHLGTESMARLHYGLWLGRQLQAPVMVSGGIGRAQTAGPAEADVAARITSRDYGRSLRWLENGSVDTRDNARKSLELLRNEGITEVFLVTHGWHMRRAVRAFNEEAAKFGSGSGSGSATRIVPAPMGVAADDGQAVLQWLPSPEGYRRVHQVLREMLGQLAGA